MKIEPEALYSMFDTLFLPVVKTDQGDKKALETKSNKNLLMLFDKKYSNDEKDFLNKILAAINIKPEEVETNFEVTPESLPEIIKKNSGYILVWGIEYPGTEKYNLIKTGEVSLIVSDSLNSLKNDQTLKAKLWNCLKEEFVK